MEIETLKPEEWEGTFKEVFSVYLKKKGDFYLVEISTKYRGVDFIDFAKDNSNIFKILNAQLIGDSWKLHIYTDLDFQDSRVRNFKHTFKLSFARKYKEYVNLVMSTLGKKLWLDCKSSVGDKKTKSKSKFISIVNYTIFFKFNKKVFCYDCKLKKSFEYLDFRQLNMFSNEVIEKVDFEFFESFIKK